GHNAEWPEIALDGRGDPTFVFSREAIVQVASGTAAGVFSAPAELGYPGIFDSIAEDPAGDTVVGYFNPAQDSAAASFRPAGGYFSSPQQVSPAGHAVDPGAGGADLGLNVAIDGLGDGVFGFRSLEGEALAGAALLDGAGPALNGLSIPTSAATGTPT